MTTSDLVPLWIGTFPASDTRPGSGEGIWRVDVDAATGAFGAPRLAAEVASPTFLARHPSQDVLYAASETDPGRLTALRVASGELTVATDVASGGDSPCHVAASGSVVWAANYGDGVATAVATDETGLLTPEHRALHVGSGSGPVTERQEGPHAHQVVVAGQHVLVTDLGADVVRRYPVDPAVPGEGESEAADADDSHVAARLPGGSGPRHLVVLPSGALVVVGELDARLHLLVPVADGYEHVGSVPASPAADPDETFPGHITLLGDTVHVGLRGPDALAVHRVRDGAVPELEHLADTALGAGAWPRHHELVSVAETVLVVVALQGTSELVAVRLDPASGAGEVVSRESWATPPACVLVAR